MSYLKIPFQAPINGQSYMIIPKSSIAYIAPNVATPATIVDIFLKEGNVAGALDAIRITFNAAAAAGFSLVDSVQEALVSNPGGLVSTVGGIPATLSVTAPGVVGGQALTFCSVTAWVLA
tara:strand:- start:15 stop:374 length:360 start_codon:yes stop_codon:yes gene_type:complete